MVISQIFWCWKRSLPRMLTITFVFILIMDGLSHKIKVVFLEDIFHGLMVGHYIWVSHSFFVDNILLFSILSRVKWVTLQHVFYRFRSALGLITNTDNSLLLFAEGRQEDIKYIAALFGVEKQPICFSLKYLGFNIKPNYYKVNDWMWITNIFHKNITMWEHQCLTLGGRVTLTSRSYNNLQYIGHISFVYLPRL